MRRLLLSATLLTGLGHLAYAATYTVVAPGQTPSGPTQFASLGALANADSGAHSTHFLQPGDIIQLPAGALAPNDCATLRNIGSPANPVWIKSPPGQYTLISMPNFNCGGKAAMEIYSSSIHFDGIVFLGDAFGSDGNGAGIRAGVNYGTQNSDGTYPPYNITVTNSAFLDDGNGILADDCSNSAGFDASFGPQNASGTNRESGPCTVKVSGSLFSGNGDGSGLTHNLYIDRVDEFDFTGNLSIQSREGHLLKSRAFNGDFEGNRFFDDTYGYSNNNIDMPQGGNYTIKHNIFQAGPHKINNGVFMAYNEEEYYGNTPPLNQPNNPGGNLDIESNVFIDNWSAAHGGNAPPLLMDATWWTGKDSNPAFKSQTNGVNPSAEVVTFKSNTIYSNALNTTNWCLWCWSKDVLDPSNQFLPLSQAPALDNSLPLSNPWPATVPSTLTVTMNGVENDCNQGINNPTNSDDCGFPHAVIWFDGQPVAFSVIRANHEASPPQVQTVQATVPAFVGSVNFVGFQFQNPGCCFSPAYPDGARSRLLYWLSATLNGAAPAGGPGPQAIFDALYNPPTYFAAQGSVQQPPPPPTDTTAPVLAPPATIQVNAGASAAVSLSATDDTSGPTGLTYTLLSAPKLGQLLKSGAALGVGGTFTQADVASQAITYAAGSAGGADSVSFTLADAAGNKISGVLPVSVTTAVVTPPPPPATPPSVTLEFEPDGTVHWK